MGIEQVFSVVMSLMRGGDQLLGWLFTYAVHSTLLLALVWWLMSRPWIRWSGAARHAIWTAAMVAGFVTSAVQVMGNVTPLGGAMRVMATPHRMLAAVRVDNRAPVLRFLGARDGVLAGSDFREARQIIVRTPSSAALIPPVPVPGAEGPPLRAMFVTLSASLVAAATWGAVAAGLLILVWLRIRRLQSRLAHRSDASGTLAGRSLAYLRTCAGVRREVMLSVCEAIDAPAAISAHEIVVPPRVLSVLPLLEQESLLAHELAHVVRRDTWWLRLSQVVCAVGWFQPLNHVARRQMQIAAEFAADEWAVRLTQAPVRLAKALAQVAEWLAPRGRGLGPMLAGAGGSPLLQRVQRLTAPPSASPRLGWVVAALALATSSALTVSAAPRIDVGRSVTWTGSQSRVIRVQLRDQAGASAAPMVMQRGSRDRTFRIVMQDERVVR